ncbi:MAG: hypothetical protein ACHQ53_02335 [Polyangiales bacterium]
MTPSRSTASNALIALFLLYQIAMPLRYYLGGGGDDERFSWRMFSTVRMHKCSVRMDEVRDGQTNEVELGRAVQIAWISMLERNRPQVVRKLLRHRCTTQKAQAVKFERRCTDTDGSALPPLLQTMRCADGRVVDSVGAP